VRADAERCEPDHRSVNRRLFWGSIAAFLLGIGVGIVWLSNFQWIAPVALIGSALAGAWSFTGSLAQVLKAALSLLAVMVIADLAALLLQALVNLGGKVL
jgi:hypothetical protein